MPWGSKRQLPNEEYLPLFRKWCTTYAQAIVDAVEAASLEPDKPGRVPDILTEFDGVQPQYKPYRPIHRALVKLAWAQYWSLMSLGAVGFMQDSAKTLRELQKVGESTQYERLMERVAHDRREAARLNNELERRFEALPESDPIRLMMIGGTTMNLDEAKDNYVVARQGFSTAIFDLTKRQVLGSWSPEELQKEENMMPVILAGRALDAAVRDVALAVADSLPRQEQDRLKEEIKRVFGEGQIA